MSRKLYPPNIGGTIPAFCGTVLTVPFSMNKAVGKSEIGGFALKIKTVNGEYKGYASVTESIAGQSSATSGYDLTKFEVKTNAEMYFNAISSCSSRPFNHVDSVYLFTNENIPVILENSNLNGKLLTVTASLDQALNAILYGVNDITMFDINKIAKFFAEHKISAIKFLSYEDFLKLYNL